MSGSVDLLIETGADWGIQISWKDGEGVPYPFSDPIMNIRQDLNPSSRLIAKLDETAQWDGVLTIVSPGTLQARMTAAQTNNLSQGYGFWDIFVTLYGNRVRLVFGTIAIAPHVTELSNV